MEIYIFMDSREVEIRFIEIVSSVKNCYEYSIVDILQIFAYCRYFV